MNNTITYFKLYNEADFEDNDEYPSEEEMLGDITKAWCEYHASERGDVELRTTYIDSPTDQVVVQAQINYVIVARLTVPTPGQHVYCLAAR